MRIEIAKISNKKKKEDASFNSYINKQKTNNRTSTIAIDIAIVIGIETDIQLQHLKTKLKKNTVRKVENRKKEHRKSKIIMQEKDKVKENERERESVGGQRQTASECCNYVIYLLYINIYINYTTTTK